MPTLKTYRLARSGARIPMPDRGGRLFGEAGETVDIEQRYYATLIADGDIVPTVPEPADPPPEEADEPPSDNPEPDAPGASSSSRRKGKSK